VRKFIKIAIVLMLGTCLWSCSSPSTGFSLPSENVDFSGGVTLNKKVDILFVVDNTPSMLQHQQKIAAQLTGMITSLNDLKMDYRFAVTTTSMGSGNASCAPISRRLQGNPLYLTENNISLLPDRFVVGSAGCSLERGLDAMAYVTSSSYLSSAGTDFLRADALLVINFISDEQDSSSEFGDSGSNDFINLLNERKPAFEDGSRAWIANFIGTLSMKETCDTGGGSSSVGSNYVRLVDASLGIKSSICSLDLSVVVSNIKARIIDHLKSYRFNEEPNKATIQVTIGGRAVHENETDGWTLESELRADGKNQFILKFHGAAIPKADEPVKVVYKAAYAT
jgi:hypothetical protein